MNRGIHLPHINKIITVGTIALLSACTTAAEQETLSQKLSAAAIYDPVVADGITTITEALGDETSAGVTGFMGFSDGTVKPVLVRTNADQSVLYISIDGAPAIEMARDYDDFGYSEYSTETEYAELNYYSSDGNYVYFDGGELWGEGHYGMEAPAEALSGTARYQGYANAGGENSYLWGDLTIGVDFASGGLIGLMSGGYEQYGDEEYEYSEVIGSIAGTVSGSRMAGVLDINTESVSGQLDMLGAFYGTEGNSLAGGMAGSLNDETLGGEFTTSTRFREECCFELR